MRKKELIRENSVLRENAASVLPMESISGAGDRKYQDVLIKGGYHDFFDNYSRKEVVLNDAIGERVTLGFLKHIFEKLPKFCENDEVQAEYIMEDVRDALDTLNLKPKFISIGVNAIVNGWSLVKWDLEDNGLQCKIFGYEECHPRYWSRFTQPPRSNLIQFYRAIYIPRPLGMEAFSSTLTEERYLLSPSDPTFQHLTRIDRNYGFGFSRLQPIWDAITKLRERSDSDHFLKSNFLEVRYPQSWTANDKAKKFVDKARKANKTRGIAIEAVTNPNTNEDTGLPSIIYRPWGQGPTGQAMDPNKASAYLDGEWLRLLVNLGYSQAWATGAAAGALEGSEINLTRDDRADIAEFSILESIFKDILKRLAELGIMAAIGVSNESIQFLLSKKYKMVSWLTWEYNDKAAIQQEQLDHQMEMEKGKSDDRNAYDKSNELRENEFDDLIDWVKEHIASDHDAATEIAFRIIEKRRSEGREKQDPEVEWKKNWGWLGSEFDKLRLKREMITRDDVKRAFYKQSKLTHPDKGGTAKAFIDVHKAYEKIMTELKYKGNSAQHDSMIDRYNETVEAFLIEGLRNNENRPMTPVMSAWVDSVGVYKGHLAVKTKIGPKIAMYPFGDNAMQKYYEMTGSGSKGEWLWDNVLKRPSIYGMESGELFEKGSKIGHFTPPGRPAMGDPDFIEGQIGSIGETAGSIEEMREFKMEGEESMGIIGAGTTREPLRFMEPIQPHYETAEKGAKSMGTTEQVPYGGKPHTEANPKAAGAKRKRGRSTTREPRPQPYIFDYPNPYSATNNEKFKEILNSKSALMRFAKGIKTDHSPMGWSMKSDTPYKIRELVNALSSATIRLNRVSFGNSIKAGHPYNYGGEDEYICPKDYKQNIGKKVPLGIYHNLDDRGNVTLPEWQVIGTHEVLGWDDLLGGEIAKNEYDENKINEFFEKRNEENWIQPYLDAGKEPPISGAYSCAIKKHNGKNFQVNIDLKSMSFVPDANCPWDICNFKPEVKV